MYNPASKYTDRLFMDNSMVLTKLSQYLSMTPDFIDSHMIEEMNLGSSCKMQEYSFALLLASSLSLDIEEKYEGWKIGFGIYRPMARCIRRYRIIS